MPHPEMEGEGRLVGRSAAPELSAEFTRIADQLYEAGVRRRLGRSAPSSLALLLESRGVGVDIERLMELTAEVVFALPETRRMAPNALLTDAEVATLEDGGFGLEPSDDGAEPMSLGIARYARLIATCLSVAGAAEILGVNSSRVRQRLKARSLYGFKLSGGWLLPQFQFDRRRLVPAIERVIQALPEDLHPVAVATWFATPNPDLVEEPSDRLLTPLDWLRSGHGPTIVAELATHL
ncbi:MAG: hypothetical protein ACC742_13005 [Thermoanaerobaculales bacterium]